MPVESQEHLALMLVEHRLLDADRAHQALREARDTGFTLIEVLARSRRIDARALAGFLSRVLQLDVVDLDRTSLPPRAVANVPQDLCRWRRFLPISLVATPAGEKLAVAMVDPGDLVVVRWLESGLARPVLPLLVDDDSLERAIQRRYALPPIPGLESPSTEGAAPDPERPADALPLLEPLSSTALASTSPFDWNMQLVEVQSTNIMRVDSGELSLFVDVAVVPESGSSTVTVARPQAKSSSSRSDVAASTRQTAARTGHGHDSSEEPTVSFQLDGTLRVLVVGGDEPLRQRVQQVLAPLVKALYFCALPAEACELLTQVRVDDVVVFGPKNDARTGQLLAKMSRRAKTSIVVVSDDDSFDGLDFVRSRQLRPQRDADPVGVIVRALQHRRRRAAK